MSWDDKYLRQAYSAFHFIFGKKKNWKKNICSFRFLVIAYFIFFRDYFHREIFHESLWYYCSWMLNIFIKNSVWFHTAFFVILYSKNYSFELQSFRMAKQCYSCAFCEIKENFGKLKYAMHLIRRNVQFWIHT